MKLNNSMASTERVGILFVSISLIAAFFIHLGLYPLYLEEPRRALITLEMIYNGNWVVPTEFGEYYYRKPPGWNWVQIVSFKLFGANEFGARFFGIVSYLSMGAMLYWMVKKFMNERLAIYSALAFLTIGSGLLYMTSAAGEVDLLYCVITLLMFMTIYYYYEKKKYVQLFIVAYLLTGVGVLVKGLPSGIFLGLTLLGLFVDKRKFKLFFGYKHLLGILTLFFIVGAYAYAYNQHHDFSRFFFQTDDESLIQQSASKSFMVNNPVSIIKHIFTFPLRILYDLLPFSVLIIFIFNKSLIRYWWKTPFMRYLMITFIVNVAIYWLSPMTRTRYLYMLFPILIIFLVHAYLQNESVWKERVWHWFSMICMFLLLIGCISMPFLSVDELNLIVNLGWTSIIFTLLVAGIIYVYFRRKELRLLCLIAVMVVFRFIFDFVGSPIRSRKSNMLNRKNEGIAIGTIVKPNPVFLYKYSETFKGKKGLRQIVFYTEQQSENFVRLSDAIDSTHFFLVEEKYMTDMQGFTSHYEVTLDQTKIHLVKFEK